MSNIYYYIIHAVTIPNTLNHCAQLVITEQIKDCYWGIHWAMLATVCFFITSDWRTLIFLLQYNLFYTLKISKPLGLCVSGLESVCNWTNKNVQVIVSLFFVCMVFFCVFYTLSVHYIQRSSLKDNSVLI